jgi:leucyl aminopeptidase
MPRLAVRDAATNALPIWPVTTASLDAWLEKQDEAARQWVRANAFKAETGRVLLLPGAQGAVAGAVLGLGDGSDALAAGALAAALPEGAWRWAGADRDPAVTAFAVELGAYRYDRYKERPETRAWPTVAIEGADRETIADAGRIAEAVFLVRDLVNTPASDMGPEELEKAAREIASAGKAEIKVITGDDLLKENFPLIHAVGRASTRAPRLIDLRWGPADAPRVTLVGKGVCFDTGGLNLKPGNSMALMKKDMGGAAHVLGLAQLIMASKLNLRLRVLAPTVENAVAGNAFRPGDVLPSRKGITVEIGNTDAEGRLILADALALASEEKPELLIDIATLTGAARVALGPELQPFYTDDERLAGEITHAAEAVADPVWRMPLWQPYAAWLDSQVADVNHISGGTFAGSVTAALFLKRFVAEGLAWAHFDIRAWTDKAKPGRPVGGEAQALRALYHVLKGRYGG